MPIIQNPPPGGIKQIIRGNSTGGHGTVNITIPTVNMAKTFVVSSQAGGVCGTGNYFYVSCRLRITTATNLEIYTDYYAGNVAANWLVSYEVVEYY